MFPVINASSLIRPHIIKAGSPSPYFDNIYGISLPPQLLDSFCKPSFDQKDHGNTQKDKERYQDTNEEPVRGLGIDKVNSPCSIC
jgi:hypothetical protein